MSEDVGRRVEPGDTMIDLAHGAIYEHQEEPRFVTWDEALERIVNAVHEGTTSMALTAIRLELKDNPGLAQMLQTWHEARDYECCAHSEGQACCIDELLGSTEPSA